MVKSIHMIDAEQEPIPGNILEAMLDVWDQTGEKHVIPIIGTSMLPMMKGGDQVLVVHGSAGVRRGDVIVFRCNGNLIAHRVLRIYESDGKLTFITKGDNVSQCDPPVSANAIIGRVLAIKRGSRHITVDTPVWRTLGWFVASGTVVWIALYRYGQRLKRRTLGHYSHPCIRFLWKGVQTSSLLIRKIVFAFLCR